MGKIRVGYFFNQNNGDKFKVTITPNEATETEEITLAGSSPFTVSYETNATPFEPMRQSTAVISVVNDDYMIDIYSPYATGTSVELYKTEHSSYISGQ